MKVKIVLLSLLLSSCAVNLSSYDTQCTRNPKVDGPMIAGMLGIPFAVVSSSTPVGLGIGALMGGAYYVTHEASCK